MPAETSSGEGGPIGVVVIGRNESANLGGCLQSLSRYRNRLVYADSASTDDSPEIARKFGSRVVELDASKPLTPARGRNEGLTALLRYFPDCEFVQFVDGDGIVEPGWIEAGAEFLRTNGAVAVVCGHVAEAQPARSIYNWLCAEEWKGSVGRIDACGGNAMFRVEVLEHVGAFRGDLPAGEEAELMARIRAAGWKVWRIDAPMVIHDAAIYRFSDWWRRARRGGFAYGNVWSLTKHCAEPLYATQLRSSLIWIFALPIALLGLALATREPALLLLIPAAWLLQIGRIAAQRGFFSARSWGYAGMIMLAKAPEAIGVMEFLAGTISTRRRTK